MMEINKLIRSNIRDLTPYSSARDEFKQTAEIYLDANENPFDQEYNRYPDSSHSSLRKVIGNLRGVTSDKIVLGNGSDEIIDMVLRAFCNPDVDNVIITPPTYGMYEVAAAISNVEVKRFQQDSDFNLDWEGLLKIIDDNTKVVFLCSPNNPTGRSLKLEEICDFISRVNCLVFVDEAYIDFSSETSLVSVLDDYPNLIVSQTLSKFFGMAGLRVGICFSSVEIIETLFKIKPPYNLNSFTLEYAEKQLLSKDWQVKKTNYLESKQRLLQGLETIEVIDTIVPSDANFYLIKVPDAKSLYDFLLANSVVVRNRSSQSGCENMLRISVGTRSENERLINLLKQYANES